MSRIVARMTRAALLDAQIYEEVEADRSATPQAFAVVVLASIAAGIGSLENNGWSGIGYITVAALVGWLVWAGLTCVIGTRILPRAETVSDLGELLRTLGFASSPGILLVFAAIPAISRDGRCRAPGPRLRGPGRHREIDRRLCDRLPHLRTAAGHRAAGVRALADLMTLMIPIDVCFARHGP